MYVKDQSTQTQDTDINTSPNSKRDSDQIPTYAFIDKKPPPSPSSVHNGRVAPKKFVTIGGYASQNADLGSSHDRLAAEYGTSAHENNRFNSKYSTSNARRQQQLQQGPQRVAQQSYAFPMNSSHPTPYSTLKQQNQRPAIALQQQQMQQQQQNDIQQHHFRFNSYAEDMDYDNPAESTPLVVEKQQSVQFKPPNDDTFEPTPLVYPSARRPITFDQMTSSKMSIYDNVQFGLDTVKLDRDKD